jgi:signal transduction histidine kinase
MPPKPADSVPLDRPHPLQGTPRPTGSYFAEAERLAEQQLQQQLRRVGTDPLLNTLLTTTGGLLAVLNEHRQILAINESLLHYLGIGSADRLLGLRLGEVMHCPHAGEMAGGCGTSKYCSTCGAAIAQAVALRHQRPAERLCALDAVRDNVTIPLFLRVRATPLELGGHPLILLFIEDITRQQQSALAERAFYHDLNNTLTSLLCASSLLAEEEAGPHATEAKEVLRLAEYVVRELDLQRQLVAATAGTIQPVLASTPLDVLFDDLRSLITHHPASNDKLTTIIPPRSGVTVRTDTTLLLRVLTNMALNALESTPPGGEVRITAETEPAAIHFHIWNETPIPPEIARRVFQRNFSTKGGLGRGLGTFSMKLIGEQLLGGRVSFESSALDGTTFRFVLPV